MKDNKENWENKTTEEEIIICPECGSYTINITDWGKQKNCQCGECGASESCKEVGWEEYKKIKEKYNLVGFELNNKPEKRDEIFFNKLADKLEELFPKLNTDTPHIKSPNHRSEALSLNAFANIYHNEALQAQKKDERCTKCKAPFEPHHHKHITREGTFHTSCYQKEPIGSTCDDTVFGGKENNKPEAMPSEDTIELLSKAYANGSKEKEKLMLEEMEEYIKSQLAGIKNHGTLNEEGEKIYKILEEVLQDFINKHKDNEYKT